MNIFKRVLSLLLVCALIFTSIKLDTVHAATGSNGNATISVESIYASPGENVTVNISIANNPGILGATLEISYDSGLTLTGANAGAAFSYLQMTKPGKYTSPCKFNWDGQQIDGADLADGIILSLSFTVDANATASSVYGIHVKAGDIYDNDINSINVSTVDGAIQIMDYIPGDLNEDGSVSITDIILARRYIVGGYDINIRDIAGDVNEDGKITSADVIILRRYIVGGYGVIPKPSPWACIHEMEAHEQVVANCVQAGNPAYWFCNKCNKYYSDERGLHEMNQADTVIPKTDHHLVEIPAIEPTETADGWTAGQECSVCHTVTIPPQPWKLAEYTINYDLDNGDNYLAQIVIENKNPATLKGGSSWHLVNPTVTGYRFLGWFDGAGNNAVQIRDITNIRGNMQLYAHWEPIAYPINFLYDTRLAGLIDTSQLTNVTYTINEKKTLPVIALPGYTFTGWSDDEGNICTIIHEGATGAKTYYANWISNRNQAWSKKKLGSPIIYNNDKVILFTYEIGEMRNVPIYEIENFGGVISGGIPQEVEKTFSASTQTNLMESYTRAIEKATTDSANWTLSEDWTKSNFESNENATENGYTYQVVDAKTNAKTDENHVSKSNGGSSSRTVHDSTDTYDLQTTTNNKKTYNSGESSTSTSNANELGLGIKASIGTKTTLSSEVYGEAGADTGIASAKTGFKAGVSEEISASLEGSVDTKTTSQSGASTLTKSGSDVDNGDGTQTGTVRNHSSDTVNSSSWNSESGYSSSTTTSSSNEISQALSQQISAKTGWGSSYTNGGGSSSSQGLTSTSSSSDGYASSVAYSTITSKEESVKYTTANTMTGYHRWVIAGTAHVFGVVAYDIAADSYYVYTYSIMDDAVHKFEDYSYCTASFDDNQSGLIDFEIPAEILDYVNVRTFATDGLVFDLNGNVTQYKGTDSLVIIPEYARISNGDGTNKAVKVTGITENAFKGNDDITGVLLSTYITDIPANAFANCTELWEVGGKSVSRIGANAFAGCQKLKSVNLSKAITNLGANAFNTVKFLQIDAANAGVVEGAVKSGAKEIVIGLSNLSDSLNGKTLNVPSSTKCFTLRGYDKSFNNLTIVSDAETTKLNRLTLNADSVTPLQLTSADVSLYQMNVNCKGIAATLLANATNASLFGQVNIGTEGPHAVLTRNLALNLVNSNLQTDMNVTGNLVTSGSVTDVKRLLKFNNGQIISVTDEQLERMLHAYTLNFDANGGQCDTTSKKVDNATPIGTMPVPTRYGYTFDGWYTERDGGTKVTESTVYSTGEDRTIYAHWKLVSFTVSFDANGGSVSQTSKIVEYSKSIGTLPTPTRTYYNFNGWYTAKSGGTKVTDTTVLQKAENVTLYAQWSPVTFTVTFNGNGGTASQSSKTVTYTQAIGTLPSASRDYYTFDGWYTAASGGTKVEATTVLSQGVNTTLYAHWTIHVEKGWVQASQVPAGAQITQRKWTYTRTTLTESTNTSLSGYTSYDSYWVQNASGSFVYSREFPSGFDTGNWYYQNWNRDPYGAYENTTNKRTVSTNWGGYVYWHWMYDTNYANGVSNRAIYHKYGTGPDNGYLYKYFGAFDSTTNYPSGGRNYCNSQNIENFIVSDRTSWDQCQGATRWFRFNYYWCNYTDYYKVFKYRKVENNLESTTNPTGQSGVSNVVEYVKYREK